MDAGGRVIEFNPAAEKLYGFRRDEVLGQAMADFLIPERYRPRFLDHIRTFVETGDPEEFTGQMRIGALRADGTERTVELTPVQITVGGATVFTGFLRDLTEIERSHAALADQTERLNCLIATAIPGVLITDEQGRITHVSRSFGAMFGLDDPPGLVGTPALAVVSRIQGVFADPAGFIRRVAEMLRARQPMSGEQIECADGRTVECDYWPILVDGRFRGDLWLTWDMSDRKELEQQRMAALEAELAARQLAEQAQRQLTAQNERLQRIDEARNQFLAIVSHELRTPLTSIVSFIELIRGEAGGLTPEGLSFLDIIERNADRLHRLIGDLLMLDRLEAGALPLDMATVSIADLVTEAVRTATPSAAKQGVTLEISAFPGPPVAGDSRRLMQVLDNLIANAVKFSHRNGLVRVTAAWRDRNLADRRGGLRHRHPPGGGQPAVQPVRPGVQRADRRAARVRPGAVHRQGPDRDARRAGRGAQRAGPGQHVQRLPADGAVSPGTAPVPAPVPVPVPARVPAPGRAGCWSSRTTGTSRSASAPC